MPGLAGTSKGYRPRRERIAATGGGRTFKSPGLPQRCGGSPGFHRLSRQIRWLVNRLLPPTAESPSAEEQHQNDNNDQQGHFRSPPLIEYRLLVFW